MRDTYQIISEDGFVVDEKSFIFHQAALAWFWHHVWVLKNDNPKRISRVYLVDKDSGVRYRFATIFVKF